MTPGEIEDREKWLILARAILPVALLTRNIPDLRRRWAFELIVSLAVVGAIVSCLFQQDGERRQPLRQLGIASHVVSADAVLVHARDDG